MQTNQSRARSDLPKTNVYLLFYWLSNRDPKPTRSLHFWQADARMGLCKFVFSALGLHDNSRENSLKRNTHCKASIWTSTAEPLPCTSDLFPTTQSCSCKSETHPHLGLNRTNSFLFIEERKKKKINKQERKVTMGWTWFTGKANCQGIQARIHRWFIKQVIEMSKERAIERSPSSSPPLIISYCWKWPFLQVSRPFWSAEDFRKWKLVLKGTKVLQKHFIKGCILLLSPLPLVA